MSVPVQLASLAGEWQGVNKLYMSGASGPVVESQSDIRVFAKAKGQFIGLEYTWSYLGDPQEGILIVGCDPKSNEAQVVWTDSWHMSHKFMVCNGEVDGGGMLDVKGFYSVPGYPDWGWRTEIRPAADHFDLVMFNVSPEGDEDLAVETRFTRK